MSKIKHNVSETTDFSELELLKQKTHKYLLDLIR